MWLLFLALNSYAFYPQETVDEDEQVIVIDDLYITCRICGAEVLILSEDAPEESDEEIGDLSF